MLGTPSDISANRACTIEALSVFLLGLLNRRHSGHALVLANTDVD